MKLPNKSSDFKDRISKSLDESVANYGGTNTISTVQGGSKNKFSPATVLKAEPLRYQNHPIQMGQSRHETQAPAPMIYPFESIFTELVDIYMRIENIARTTDGASEMPTLSKAKKETVEDSVRELVKLKHSLHKIITKLEEITI